MSWFQVRRSRPRAAVLRAGLATVVALCVSLPVGLTHAAPPAQVPPDQPTPPEPAPPAQGPALQPTGADRAPAGSVAPVGTIEPAHVGDDRVHLKNGGMIRGDVIESMPDSHVTIVVTGETQRFAWADVQRVQLADESPGSLAHEPDPPGAALAPAVGQPRIHMTVRGDKRVQLKRITEEGGNIGGRSVTLITVCESPCDRVIQTSGGRRFMVGHDTWTFSRKLDLGSTGPELDLEVVRPGDRGMRISGAVLFAIGLVGTVAGGFFLLSGGWLPGAVTAGAAVPFVGIGLPLMILGRAKVRVRP